MRPTRGPYARPDGNGFWYTRVASVLLALIILMVPVRIFFPDIFPGAMMWLLGAVAVLLVLWTTSAEARRYLQPHQIYANLVIAALLVLFIILLGVQAPTALIVAVSVVVVIVAVYAMYRRSD